MLPVVLSEFIPVDVDVTLQPRAIVTGLVVGLWVAMAFSLVSLLRLRRVSPLQAIRRDADPGCAARDGAPTSPGVCRARPRRERRRHRHRPFGRGGRGAVGERIDRIRPAGALGERVVPVVARPTDDPRPLAVHVRQGIANLQRPSNQTRPVVLALGFGVFLVTTVYLVQTNLLRQFTLSAEASIGNLLFFDVQEDQAPVVDSIVKAEGYEFVQRVPIVTMRIAEINGRTVRAIIGERGRRGGRWALNREYRSHVPRGTDPLRGDHRGTVADDALGVRGAERGVDGGGRRPRARPVDRRHDHLERAGGARADGGDELPRGELGALRAQLLRRLHAPRARRRAEAVRADRRGLRRRRARRGCSARWSAATPTSPASTSL